MKIKNNLNTYEDTLISDEQKLIFKVSLIMSLIVCAIGLLLVIFSLISYKIVIGYVLGCLTSNFLFYSTIKTITNTNPVDFKKAIKKMSMFHNGVYLLMMLASYLITQNIFAFVAAVIGMIQIKIPIICCNIKGVKKD